MDKENLNFIAQTLFDKKGFNILALDVKGISTITDYIVIAEGAVSRHVSALGEAVRMALKEKGQNPLVVEGKLTGDWIVLDYLSCMVHIFSPDQREKYRLEELWHEGKIVDLKIDTKEEERV